MQEDEPSMVAKYHKRKDLEEEYTFDDNDYLVLKNTSQKDENVKSK